MKYKIVLILLVSVYTAKSQDSSYYPLRCLGINVGNVSFNCWESKLCEQAVVNNIRNYIQTWSPDIIMISEVYRRAQMDSTAFFGPILPAGYSCDCGKSINRYDSLPAAWDTADASHEHECVAWKTALFTLVPNSSRSVYGRNDTFGLSNCNYDFTAHRVRLVYKGFDTITPVALHPNSMYAQCRTYEIDKYWTELCTNSKTIIAGDWNTDVTSELQVQSTFQTIFSKGHYWNLFYSSGDYSQTTFLSSRHLDHAFSNFGEPCTTCGSAYGTGSLQYGAALGGYNHPRADGGSGMDHRQILMDMNVKCALPQPAILVTQQGNSYTYSCNALPGELVLWNFGNNNYSSSSYPAYIDSLEDAHVVTLTLTNNCGSKTDSVAINATGINNGPGISGISIYPNPVSSTFVLEIKGSVAKNNIYTLELIDPHNNTVMKEKLLLDNFGRKELNIEYLPSASYVLVLRENAKVIFSGTIIKSKM
jgi:hypothetical protein